MANKVSCADSANAGRLRHMRHLPSGEAFDFPGELAQIKPDGLNEIMRDCLQMGDTTMKTFLLHLLTATIVLGGTTLASGEALRSVEVKELLDGLIFFAPFDGSPDAQIAAGDGRIYTAPPSRDPTQRTRGLNAAEVVVASDRGRYGDALHFRKKTRNMVFFYADKNTGYREKNWNGTISMWLRIDPADLQQEFADPVQITDKKYNDAALWVDFTKDDTPPHFRMGVFADAKVWNARGRKPNEIPESEQPIVRVEAPPFGSEKWTHVVMTFAGFNNEGTNSEAKLFINGELQGTLRDRWQLFHWDLSRATIRVGLGYVGLLDELSIYNRALSAEEVQLLYKLPGGLRRLAKGSAPTP